MKERYCPDCFRKLVKSRKYTSSYVCRRCQDVFAEEVTFTKQKVIELKGGKKNNGRFTKVQGRSS